tara:strand:- start:1608 stop:2360 length:753 start_codon:yes stop_codon:yes gene_type:complete
VSKVRIIPTILYDGDSAVKGKKFNSWRKIGSLKQIIKLYSLREVDELIFLDVNANSKKKIELDIIDDFADDCFMPITAGGGVKKIIDIENLLKAGVDRVCINSAVYEDYNFVKKAIKYFGSQCIVVSVDYKIQNKKRFVFIKSGKKNTKIELFNYLKMVQDLDPGEVLINCIDKDGMMNGYDVETLKKVERKFNFQIIACGGAKSEKDIHKLIKTTNIKAISCSSIFQFTEITPLKIKEYLLNKGYKLRK